MSVTVAGAKFTKADLVRRDLVSRIEQGLEHHDKLPTERELAEEFDVSRLTVRRALAKLESDGVVYRVQGSGTFVGHADVSKALELTSFSEDIRSRGMVPGSQLISIEVVPAGSRVAYPLELSPTDRVVNLNRIRLADSEPMCLENSFIPEVLVPGLADNLGDSSLYQSLEELYGLTLDRADQVLRATVLDPEEAELLKVPAFTAAFLVTRTLFDKRSRPIEYAESLYRADRYQYEMTVQRRIQ